MSNHARRFPVLPIHRRLHVEALQRRRQAVAEQLRLAALGREAERIAQQRREALGQ